ncbi:uncharacterized protein ANIA_11447 [Aspergillus nidulans FGSC A4]|uniref:Uncharacterized protein n=1 Tax=Emericella nidulans (strain FGSC A4 / ATCC 38163 / CBS 112.46 / NRRL 194 / M139) TaxID=227321 RepID=C8VAK1_EMENI|nr:hypothetical protein [Aspergillus nidulans FGSC A4]CBF76723.1 TPA: hypothetical protein ANIA_11447 [Aspergillus nidulans FGSC A4]
MLTSSLGFHYMIQCLTGKNVSRDPKSLDIPFVMSLVCFQIIWNSVLILVNPVAHRILKVSCSLYQPKRCDQS